MKDNKSRVALVRDPDVRKYPSAPPFNPPESYPEFAAGHDIDTGNRIYSMVRELLQRLELDKDNYGSEKWNPLGEIIKPGQNVVIKPNLAKHEHHLGDDGLLSTITHGSVLRPIIDYVNIALKGKGRITVCDTPVENSDFKKMCDITGIRNTVSYLKGKGCSVELVDLRKYTTVFYSGNKTRTVAQNGDPDGYVIVDLKEESEFDELENIQQNYHTLADHTVDHYSPFCKDEGKPNKHHHKGKHEYLVPRTVLNADVVISVPKLKTHGKAGVTLNLKNMIGIVTGKNYIPHHRPGNAPYGDAFPVPPNEAFVRHRFIRRRIAESVAWLQDIVGERTMKKIAGTFRALVLERFWPVKEYQKDRIEWGDWYGNDTLWRTILDLNKILLYCDREGTLQGTQQRKYFSIIDGIIGQEGQGPTMGTPKVTSLLLSGEDPVAVDTIACRIMGLEIENIKTITKCAGLKHYLGTSAIENIIINSGDTEDVFIFDFKTPNGWEIIAKTR